MPIETVKDTKLQLVVHTVGGNPTPEEMLAAVELSSYDPPPRLLWDMTNVDVARVDVKSLKQFLDHSATLGVKRSGGKTAVVARGDLAFDLARKSRALASQSHADVELKAFRHRKAAIAWLTADKKRT